MHLREAIELNESRRPLYAAASDNRSVEVSNKLISLEKLSLFFSHLTHDFDRVDEKFQRAGLHVVCEDFVPMSLSPRFTPKFEGPAPHLSSFRELDTKAMKARLEYALEHRGFDGVKHEAELWIASLSTETRLNCLMRHTLESIVRVATLAPRHAENAKARGIESPEKLERHLLKSHWALIGQIHRLDRKAAPLQAGGLPIICNDVPSLAL